MSQIDINIVLIANNAYAQHLGVTLVSILENSSRENNFIFHILDNSLNQENKEKLKILEKKYNTKLIFYTINNDLLRDYPEVKHILKASYSRILIPDLLPQEIDKIIYIDTDTVVLKDIALLYNQNLNNFSLAAVKDVMSEEITRIYFYPGLNNYFNAGVILINLKKWRTRNISEEASNFIQKYSSCLVRADQDVLNCLFKNDWLILDDRFNVDLKRQWFLAEPYNDTVILHYSDKIKPWSYAFFGPSQKYYFHYLAKTPWSNFSFQDKNIKIFIQKYRQVLIKELKRLFLPLLPKSWLDVYRRLLWKTYKIK